MRTSGPCDCVQCLESEFRLHIGDRVSISGSVDPTVRSIFQARLTEKGVRVQGQVTKKTDLLVVSDLSEDSHSYNQAIEFGVPVCQSYQLDSLAENIAPNGRIIYSQENPDLHAISLSGKRVLFFDLDPRSAEQMTEIITSRGATVAQQLRESLACLITESKNSQKPEVLIAKSYGIPIIFLEDVI